MVRARVKPKLDTNKATYIKSDKIITKMINKAHKGMILNSLPKSLLTLGIK